MNILGIVDLFNTREKNFARKSQIVNRKLRAWQNASALSQQAVTVLG